MMECPCVIPSFFLSSAFETVPAQYMLLSQPPPCTAVSVTLRSDQNFPHCPFENEFPAAYTTAVPLHLYPERVRTYRTLFFVNRIHLCILLCDCFKKRFKRTVHTRMIDNQQTGADAIITHLPQTLCHLSFTLKHNRFHIKGRCPP